MLAQGYNSKTDPMPSRKFSSMNLIISTWQKLKTVNTKETSTLQHCDFHFPMTMGLFLINRKRKKGRREERKQEIRSEWRSQGKEGRKGEEWIKTSPIK